MFTSSGGGPSLPRLDQPMEMLVVVLIVAVLVWLGFRFFGD